MKSPIMYFEERAAQLESCSFTDDGQFRVTFLNWELRGGTELKDELCCQNIVNITLPDEPGSQPTFWIDDGNYRDPPDFILGDQEMVVFSLMLLTQMM